MFKYVSSWYQGIVKTPRPDIEEASKDLKEALEAFNKAVAHIQTIEGVTVVLQANDYRNHRFYISSGRYVSKFKLTVDRITERHTRNF